MIFKVLHNPHHPMILYRNQTLFPVVNKGIPGSTISVCYNIFKGWCMNQHRPAAESRKHTAETLTKHISIALLMKSVCFLA